MHRQFEFTLKLQLEEGLIEITQSAKDRLATLTKVQSIQVVCHRVRLYFEETKSYNLSEAILSIKESI